MLDIPESLPPAIADVSNNLINKLSDSVGLIVTPRGKKADREIAVDTYINEIKDAKINPLTKAAFISNARKTIKEYINQNDIIQMAIEQLDESANPQGVNDDWLAYFMDCAKNVCSEDVKIIWAKLLVGECNKNGSIPKRLIQILTVMSDKEATAFNKICSFSVKYNSDDGIFFWGGSDMQTEYDIQIIDVLNLVSLGLVSINIENDFQLSYNKSEKVNNFINIYHGTEKVIRVKLSQEDIEKNIQGVIPIGNLILNPVGEVLKEILVVEPAEGFMQYIEQYYDMQNLLA